MLAPLYADADLSLLFLRLVIGFIFLKHGISKLDGKMGGFMTFIGAAETLGAVALIAGFLTPLASLGISIIMLGAIWKKVVEWKIPFTTMKATGWEFDLMILAGCLVLLCFGAGNYALDASLMAW